MPKLILFYFHTWMRHPHDCHISFKLGLGLGNGVCALIRNDYRQDATTTMTWLAAAILIGAFKSFYIDFVFQLQNAT